MPRCPHCHYEGGRRLDVRRHITKVHTVPEQRHSVVGPVTKKCHFSCEFVSGREGFISHAIRIHDVEIKTKYRSFENIYSFNSWKAELERKTSCRYVQRCAVKQRETYKTVYYHCHRNGCFSTEGTGKRHSKSLGSNKIDGCCPARIKVKIHDSGPVNVEFVDSHCGHTNNLGRIFLTKTERQQIAAKISAGVSLEDISRTLIENKKVTLLNLITSKDIWNIE